MSGLARRLAAAPKAGRPFPSQFIKLGDYLPDIPPHSNAGLIAMSNAVPLDGNSYGPLAAFAVAAGALNARCQGAFAGTDTAGNSYIFAGGASRLERLTAASTAWVNVSRSAGYTTAADEIWDFTEFTGRVIASNIADPVQSFLIGTDSVFSALAAAAPRARYCRVIRDFLMLANVVDAIDGTLPQRVHWSAQGTPTSWPTAGSASAAAVLSDNRDLVGEGGWIQGLVAGIGPLDCVVFQERAVFRGMYTGLPLVFDFERVTGATGTPIPGSIIQFGTAVAYISEDGFCIFDGSQVYHVGANRVDREFWGNVNLTYLSRISGAYDPVFKRLIWSWPSGSNTTPDRLLIYTPHLDRWANAEVSLTRLVRSLGLGYTLDQLDTISGSLDALPLPLDSRAWSNNRGTIAAFDSSNQYGAFSGANLAASFTSAEREMGNGQMMLTYGIRPFVHGGTVTCQMGHRATPSASVTTTSAVSPEADGVAKIRVRNRYVRNIINVAQGGDWHCAQHFELLARPDGWR